MNSGCSPNCLWWLRSADLTEDDGFLRSRAWMLDNWSLFKRPLDDDRYLSMEVPLLYMASMKDSIDDPATLDRMLLLTL